MNEMLLFYVLQYKIAHIHFPHYCLHSFRSDRRLPGSRREYQQARAAPGYEELDAARRRVLEHDPQRVSVRACNCALRNKKEGRMFFISALNCKEMCLSASCGLAPHSVPRLFSTVLLTFWANQAPSPLLIYVMERAIRPVTFPSTLSCSSRPQLCLESFCFLHLSSATAVPSTLLYLLLHMLLK